MSRIWKKIIPLYAREHPNACSARPRKKVFLKSTVCTCAAGGALIASAVLTCDDTFYSKTSSMFSLTGAGFRFLRSLLIGATISTDYWIHYLLLDPSKENYEKRMSAIHTRNARRILDGCMKNGGTYIKIGQGLVSLGHILPPEYIHTLAWLQDKCLRRAQGEVKQIFLDEFGKTPGEMFKSFEPEPIAAASLAQVFLATTKNDERVAVKVQYKDLQQRFCGDVATIDFLLRLAHYFHPTFDFTWILDDIKENLSNELDFEHEGSNAERCKKDLAHLSYVYVPKVYWEYCCSRVLVTEFVDAIKIDDIPRLTANGHNLEDIDTKMFTAFGEQIFQIGFVHADPHPGNVLVRKHNDETQLVFLDHGLYQQLTVEEIEGLSHFWQSIVVRDRKKMDQYSKALGVDNYAEFAEVLTQTPLRKDFKFVTRLTQAQIDDIASQAQQRLDIITKTLKQMPRSLLFVIRNLNTLRAIAHHHGDPVNRYHILGRTATKTVFKRKSFFGKIMAIPIHICFEYQLFMHQMWLSFAKWYLKFLERIGRAPDTSSILEILC